MSYTQTIYVETTGNDTSGDGSKLLPYLTLTKAVSMITTVNSVIYVGKGQFTITKLQSLSLASKTVTVIGKCKDTTIYISNGSSASYLGTLELIDFIISPISAYAGDTRIISYSTDTQIVNFRNILFKRNGGYPSTAWFYTSASGSTGEKNKNLYNCTFTSILNGCGTGTINIYNCATESTSFGYINTSIDSKTNATFDINNVLTNYDNNLYGVYSGGGDFSWYQDKFLFLNNGKYYTLNDSSVITEVTPIDSTTILSGFKLANLTSTVLNSQGLKNISPFKMVVVSEGLMKQQQIQLNGIKTTSELIISKQTMSTTLAQSITKFSIEKTLVGNGDIKTVVSIDNGSTWITWNGTSWISLTNTVVDKSYSIMTTEEKTQWNNFKTEIISSGMSSTVLETADFNSIGGTNLRFAFVLIRPTYSDSSIIKTLSWTYIGKDTWNLLSTDNDISVSINEDFVKLTPIRDIDSTVKINILT